MHSMKNTDITPENLASQLKSVHKSSLTKLGNAIETAARLRRSSPSRRSYYDHAWNEQRAGGSIDTTLEETQSGARTSGVNSTPTVIVSGPDSTRKLMGVQDAEEISAAIKETGGS